VHHACLRGRASSQARNELYQKHLDIEQFSPVTLPVTIRIKIVASPRGDHIRFMLWRIVESESREEHTCMSFTAPQADRSLVLRIVRCSIQKKQDFEESHNAQHTNAPQHARTHRAPHHPNPSPSSPRIYHAAQLQPHPLPTLGRKHSPLGTERRRPHGRRRCFGRGGVTHEGSSSRRRRTYESKKKKKQDCVGAPQSAAGICVRVPF
jgi:hypothetical protein